MCQSWKLEKVSKDGWQENSAGMTDDLRVQEE